MKKYFVVAVCLTTIRAVKSESIRITGSGIISAGDDIITIDPDCSSDDTTPATVNIRADRGIQVYLHCMDSFTYNIAADDDGVNHRATVQYSGNSTTECVFSSNTNSRYYQIAAEIYYLKEGALQFKDSFLVTCTYGDYAQTNNTVGNTIEEAVVAPYETYKHIHHTHAHEHNSTSTFHIDVIDARNNIILDEVIPLGKKIKLRVTMTATSTIDKGFHVFSCEAMPKIKRKNNEDVKPFAFIREGCGEGVIISMKDGFVSTGLTAESPYFKAFEIFGSKQLKYVCHFYVCHDNCDGNSCFYNRLHLRRRREANFESPRRQRTPGVSHSIRRLSEEERNQFKAQVKENSLLESLPNFLVDIPQERTADIPQKSIANITHERIAEIQQKLGHAPLLDRKLVTGQTNINENMSFQMRTTSIILSSSALISLVVMCVAMAIQHRRSVTPSTVIQLQE